METVKQVIKKIKPNCQIGNKGKDRVVSEEESYNNWLEWTNKEIEEAKRKKMKQYFDISTFDPEIKQYTLNKFDSNEKNKNAFDETKNLILSYEERKLKNLGLMLIGNSGNGKTHLAKSLYNFLLEKGEMVVFYEWSDITSKIQNCYSGDSSLKEKIYKTLITVDWLIIDDLAVGKWSEDKEDIFLNIINPRINNKKLIIITLNDDSFLKLSDRVRSRLKQICIKAENRDIDRRGDKRLGLI